MFVCVHIYPHIYLRILICIHICVYVCVCVHIHKCIYIYIGRTWDFVSVCSCERGRLLACTWEVMRVCACVFCLCASEREEVNTCARRESLSTTQCITLQHTASHLSLCKTATVNAIIDRRIHPCVYFLDFAPVCV